MTLPREAKARKKYPIARGVLDYFPDAIIAVANVSHVGNEQHNPGQPMHWAREKSNDHADCVARHLIERGEIDDDGVRHTAKLAWRALALLQLEIEAAEEKAAVLRHEPGDLGSLVAASEEWHETGEVYTGDEITAGEHHKRPPRVYIAGPMRGYPIRNFAAFDEARDNFLAGGWDVISPADIDREEWGGDPLTDPEMRARLEAEVGSWTRDHLNDVIRRDAEAIMSCDAIAFLPGWERSTGAVAEFFVGRWSGTAMLDATTGGPIEYTPDIRAIGNAIMDYLDEYEVEAEPCEPEPASAD